MSRTGNTPDPHRLGPSFSNPPIDPIVGIDLGTTNSVAALAVESGDVHVFADERGRRLQPSVVSFHPNGSVLVGDDAKNRRIVDARNTVYSAKRLIGRSIDAPGVTKVIDRMPYAIEQDPGRQPLIRTRAGEFSVAELSAIVLDHMREIVERNLGIPVHRTVVTVPANFTDAQRVATENAGAMAGIEVPRVINEPTAAALAYGHQRALQEVIAVYDFGGGTFDITIIKLGGDVYEVLGTAGHPFLGGDDIDASISEVMAKLFLRQERIDLHNDVAAMQRLRSVAEQIKIQLSKRKRAMVKIDEIAYGVSGKPLSLRLEMTREQLEAHIKAMVDRTFTVCQEAARMAGIAPTKIGEVILVGGTTRMPYVRQRVAAFFQRAPRTDVNPAEAVAMGAALQGMALRRVLGKSSRRHRQRVVERYTSATVDSSTGEAVVRKRMRAPAFDPGLGHSDGTPQTDATVPYSLSQVTVPYPLGGEPSEVNLPQTNGTTGLGQPLTPELPTAHSSDPASQASRKSSLDALFDDLPTQIAPDAIEGARSLDQQFSSSPISMSSSTHPPTNQRQTISGSIDLSRADKGGIELDLAAMLESASDLPTQSVVLPSGDRDVPTQSVALDSTDSDDYASDIELDLSPLASRSRIANAPTKAAVPAQRLQSEAQTLVGNDTRAGHLQTTEIPVMAITQVGGNERQTVQITHDDHEDSSSPPSGHAVPAIVDVMPHGIGVGTVSGYCDVLLPRSQQVPTSISRVFTTSKDGQKSVRILVCQGESRRLEENTVLGDLVLEGVAPRPRGETRIEVIFQVDASGILRVMARDQATGVETQATLDIFGRTSADEVQASAERLRQILK